MIIAAIDFLKTATLQIIIIVLLKIVSSFID